MIWFSNPIGLFCGSSKTWLISYSTLINLIRSQSNLIFKDPNSWLASQTSDWHTVSTAMNAHTALAALAYTHLTLLSLRAHATSCWHCSRGARWQGQRELRLSELGTLTARSFTCWHCSRDSHTAMRCGTKAHKDRRWPVDTGLESIADNAGENWDWESDGTLTEVTHWHCCIWAAMGRGTSLF